MCVNRPRSKETKTNLCLKFMNLEQKILLKDNLMVKCFYELFSIHYGGNINIRRNVYLLYLFIYLFDFNFHGKLKKQDS